MPPWVGLAILVIPFLFGCATSATITPVAAAGTHLPGYIKGSANSAADRVIVFVHGVFGDGERTWTNDVTHAYFPRLVADDQVFAGADVWVDDYPTPHLSASYSIDELADHLRRHLRRDNVVTNHRQVIFVAHSMGGLVVRAYLLKYRDELPPDRVPMLYFYSTPTTGAEIASLVRLLSKNPQLGDMRKMATGKSGVLATWDAQWNSSQYSQQVKSYCAYETLRTSGVQVVQRESAEHLCNQPPDPIRADHGTIVKPASVDDESFIALREAYRDAFGRRHGWLRPAAWNLRAQERGLVQVSTTASDPSCKTCWSSEAILEPTQRVFVRVHYENDGEVAARDTHVRLIVPSDGVSDSLVDAELASNGAPPVRGAACLGASGPLALLPEGGSWYPNNSSQPLPLPYNQSASSAITGSGLAIGDVQGGALFASDVVLTFRAVPVRVIAIRDVEKWLKPAEGAIEQHGKTMELSDLAKMVSIDDLKVAPSTDSDDDSGSVGLVGRLDDLWRDEVVMLFVFIHNANMATLHHSRLTLVRSESSGRKTLRLNVMSDETSFNVGIVPLSYRSGARNLKFAVAVRLPAGFCETAQTLNDAMALPRDEDESDGIHVGDIESEDTALIICVFSVE